MRISSVPPSPFPNSFYVFKWGNASIVCEGQPETGPRRPLNERFNTPCRVCWMVSFFFFKGND